MVSSTLIYTLVSITTGLLVMPLAYLSALSGFCMKNPSLVSVATFGLFGDYGMCSYIHLEFTPLALAVLASIHVMASMRLILYRLLSGGVFSRRIIGFLELLAYILGFHIVAVAFLIYVF